MTPKPERKWRYVVPINLLAGMLTLCAMAAGGSPQLNNVAQGTLYLAFFIGLQRGLSWLGWLVLLRVLPAGSVYTQAGQGGR